MLPFTRRVRRQELAFVAVISLLAGLLSAAPVIYAWLKTPPGFWFTGVAQYFDAQDIPTYFASIFQGQKGAWLWRDLYEPERAAVFLYWPYLLLGHVARLTDLPIPFLYHLATFLAGFFLLLVLYFFIAFFVANFKLRLLAFILTAWGGGLGWRLPARSPDLLFPDFTVFPMLRTFHFLLEGIFFLAAIYFFYRALEDSSLKKVILTVGCGLIIFSFHPYMLAVLAVVGFIFFFVQSLRRKIAVGRMIRLALPWVAFLFLLVLLVWGDYLNDLRGRAASLFGLNSCFATPPVGDLLLGWGMLAPFVFLGLGRCFKKRTDKDVFLLSWFFGQLLLLFLPFSFQRIMVKWLWVAVVLLAVKGLEPVFRLVPAHRLPSLLLPLLPFTLLAVFGSTLLTVALPILAVRGEPSSSLESPAYRILGEQIAFRWLTERAGPVRVLASLSTKAVIPGFTGQRVLPGGRTPPECFERYAGEGFYSGQWGVERIEDFLRRERVAYVFYGPEERKLGNFLDTPPPFLREVFQNEAVKIFAVEPHWFR